MGQFLSELVAVGDVFIVLVGTGLVILIIYCIVFMKNLIGTVKRTNKILDDTQIVSGIAAERAKDADKVLGDVVESVGSVSEMFKGNQNMVMALTAIINSLASLKTIFDKRKK